jgi:NAD(P)-dependent dehydrogenase (short-subunit alcohol dehydrogenase family)
MRTAVAVCRLESMRILVIGASGVIGGAVVQVLQERGHDVVPASRSGNVKVDMEDVSSIGPALESAGDLDAVVCCAASGRVMSLADPDDFRDGVNGKLYGQVTLVREALRRLRDGGCVTITSGYYDGPDAAFGALVNSGLEAFVAAAAVDMPRELRLNTVSPGAVKESSWGTNNPAAIPVADVARTYLRAVEGEMTGQCLAIR